MIFANWPMLNRTHKHHHSNVNTDKDPDVFVKGGLGRLLIRNTLSGVFQLVPMFMLKWVFRDRSLSRGYLNSDLLMSASERAQHYAANTLMVVGVWAAVVLGYGAEMFALYYIPAYIASQLLSVLFQWLPHHPFEETSRFRATRNTGRIGLNLPFIWQNWHLMHHLWPAVPFYNYQRLYRRIRPILEEKGARHHEGVTPKGGPVARPHLQPAE